MSDSLSWLDEIKGERALEWVREQNARTVKQLGTSTRFQRNYERAKNVHVEHLPMPLSMHGMVHEGWLYDFMVDKAHPRGLWRRMELRAFLGGETEWQSLVDVAALAAEEERPLSIVLPIRCYKQRCLVRMEGASEAVNRGWDVREFDLETRRFVSGGFSRATAGNMAIWKDENTLLLASDFGPGTLTAPSRYPFSLREWSRGRAPTKEIFRGDPNGRAGVMAYDWPSTDARLLTVSSHDSDRSHSFVLEPGGQIVPTLLPDGVAIIGAYQGEVILQSLSSTAWTVGGKVIKGGSLLSIPRREVGRPSPDVRIVFEPKERETIAGRGVAITGSGLLIATYSNLRARLSRFTFDGQCWLRHEIAVPDHGTLRVVASDTAGSSVFVTYESFLQPPTLYAVDVHRGQARPMMNTAAQFATHSLIVEQHEAVSKDGTRIPYSVVRPRSLELNGRAPTLLHGYGAIGNSTISTPHYDASVGRLWLEQGGVYVVASIRGGGDFGPSWHVKRMERQRTYEDFIAVAEDLIRRKITSPRHLGIRGHSNGGLLVGVMLNTRPELFNAAVIEHPVLDLRVHTSGMDTEEYGAWTNPEERAYLERQSPLQNLKKRKPFPIPLLKTATDDPVVPYPARQYAAKLASFGMPFYFYESASGRHAVADTPQDAAYYDALLYTYLAEHLM